MNTRDKVKMGATCKMAVAGMLKGVCIHTLEFHTNIFLLEIVENPSPFLNDDRLFFILRSDVFPSDWEGREIVGVCQAEVEGFMSFHCLNY